MSKFVVEFLYNVDRAERQKFHPSHADYLESLTRRGVLLCAGPLLNVNGGLLIYDVENRDELQQVLDNEPYMRAGLIANIRIREWRPGKGGWIAAQVQRAPWWCDRDGPGDQSNQFHRGGLTEMSTSIVESRTSNGLEITGSDGRVSLNLEWLHQAVIDPQMDSMRLLSETAMRFPDALSFSSGAPYDGNHDISKLSYYLDRYVKHLRDSGVSEKRITRSLFQYGPVNGLIQGEVARMLKHDENIDVPPESIMVTHGCQEAMLVTLRGLFASPDDVLLTVSPTYVGIVGAARMLDITLEGVAEGAHGLEPDAVAAAARKVRAEGKRPIACYVIPDFSNPSGTALTLKMRRRLLEVAAEENLLILEDNPYGLFARDGEELPTLKSLDTIRSVIYLGSFAKSAFPGARVGYLVADQPVTGPGGVQRMLAEELSKVKSMFSVGTSSVAQAVIGGILVEADYDLRTATRELAAVYIERLEATIGYLAEHFPPKRYAEHGVRWNVPRAGFFLMVQVGFTADLKAMERSARDYGVSWAPMSMFYVDGGGERVIRLGFSNLSTEDIREGIARLARFISETPRAV